MKFDRKIISKFLLVLLLLPLVILPFPIPMIKKTKKQKAEISGEKK